jgi:signal transduction protein with GAF and PtsI domain
VQVLLGLAEDMFERLEDQSEILAKVVVNAAALLQCERCSVFVVDHDTQELYVCVVSQLSTLNTHLFFITFFIYSP